MQRWWVQVTMGKVDTWARTIHYEETLALSLKQEKFSNTSNIQTHCFSDAIFTGYGQVLYLSQTNGKGDIHCPFRMGKVRLVPLAVTVPRLEVNAAVLSVRTGTMAESELDEEIDDCTYWTDSSTVLKYLNNSQNRYKILVGDRVQTIRDNTQPVQWRYVESGAYPADDTSKRLDATCLTEQHRWIYGLEFCGNHKTCGLNLMLTSRFQITILKKKKLSVLLHLLGIVVLSLKISFNDGLTFPTDIVSRKPLHVCCRYNTIIQVPQQQQRKHRITTTSSKRTVTSQDLQNVEIIILKVVQAAVFTEEIATLKVLETNQADRATAKRKKTEFILRSQVHYFAATHF